MKRAASSDSAAPSAATRVDGAAAVACFAATALLLSWRIWRGSLFNGDEAIYAQMAREMRAGSWLDLRYHGRVLFQRPLLYPWLLCASESLLGEGALALRLPSVLAAGATAAAVFLLGRRMGGRAVGAWAALLLASLGLFVLYGRAVESDMVLTALVSWSAYAYLRARERRGREKRWLVAFGALVGAALLTKQIVGLLALVAPAAAVLARALGGRSLVGDGAGDGGGGGERRLSAAGVGIAAAAALAVALPWHVYELAVHGRAFLTGYLGVNVLARAARPIEPTPVAFYALAAWQRERWLACALALGALYAVVRAVRHREEADVLCAGWGAGTLVLLTLSRSRFDYYALVAYPALALSAARLAVAATVWSGRGGRRGRSVPVGEALVALGVAYGLALHTWPRLGIPSYSPQIRDLATTAAKVASPGEPLLVFDGYPFAARYYSGLETLEIDLVRQEYDEHRARYRGDLPGGELLRSPEQAVDLVRSLPRYLAIVPKRSRPLLRFLGQVYVVADVPDALLVSNVPGP